jgi:hypothetical protein
VIEKPKGITGRDKQLEADDPTQLVGVPVPGGDPEVMATCLVEEYARIGMDEPEILKLFQQPVYQTHALYRERGEEWVRNLIREVLRRTGRMKVSVTELHHIGEDNA